MRRREFITLLGTSVALPVAVRAQQPALPVIGYLSGATFEMMHDWVTVFKQSLAETGFTEGRDVAIEYRWAEGHNDRLPELAADLVRRGVAVIAVGASTPGALAAKAATQTIPIVFAVGTDPVKIDLVASLAHPGGNVTGVTALNVELIAKRLELMHNLMPPATTIGVLVNPGNAPQTAAERVIVRNVGAALGADFLVAPFSVWSESNTLNLGLPSGPTQRELTVAFPQKAGMILQRTRPPLLETPFEVFDRSVFTPNDQFFVRWHWAAIPQQIDVTTFRLAIRGHVNNELSLSLADILAMPRVELAAVNQCSGNSRGFFQPRVAGGQWSNGAMGNARWTGVRLRDVLDRAGVKAGAVAVRFNGLEVPVTDGAPDFLKSLAIDHARDGEVMLAYLMNGEQLPLLNGFPPRVIVPGWYSTYWVKMLNDIEVLDKPDDDFWMTKAYLIPDTPFANVKPGATDFKSVPINRMPPRSFFTNLTDSTTAKSGATVPVRGIAFGGDCGVSKVELSIDEGKTWRNTDFGTDEGKYSFRQWSTQVTAPQFGRLSLQVRCTNTKGENQPTEPNWNSGGFMRNVIERVQLAVV